MRFERFITLYEKENTKTINKNSRNIKQKVIFAFLFHKKI